MKKLIIFYFLILISTSAFAAEKVRVYTDYNPVRILYVVPGKDLEIEANKSGLKGNFKIVDKSTIPQDRSERGFWRFEKGSINTDLDARKSFEDLKTKKLTDGVSGIKKLKASGLTDDEIAALKIGG